MDNTENKETLLQAEEESIKPKKVKLKRKERRKLWKAAKKAKREEEKEYYRYAPWGKRVWNLYLKKPVVGILSFLLIAVLLVASFSAIQETIMGPVFQFFYRSTKDFQKRTL